MATGNDAVVYIHYRNHRGELRWRRVKPWIFSFASDEWHPTEQWLMLAVDLDKGKMRHFAMKDILAWSTTPPITSTSRSGQLVKLSLDGEQEATS